jgi:SM-20-related protein
MPNTESILPDTDPAIDRIALALAATGRIVLDGCLPPALGAALRERASAIEAEGELKLAGIGRGQAHSLNAAMRSDAIRWLSPDDPAEAAYLNWMEQLRLGLNQRLYLGLFDYEAHFAVYEPGAYYRKHLDAFQGAGNRVLTTVYYLNPQWTPEDAGELLIYDSDDRLLETVKPEFGKLAIFLSATHPHEVAATRRKRYSIAGWFRINNPMSGA